MPNVVPIGTKRNHRRYTAREKAQAVGIAVVDGQTIAEERTGIPKETIHVWLNRPEYAPLRTTARTIVIEEFWVGIQVGLEEVVKGLRTDAPVHQKAEALKVIADRYALLSGEATERTETRELTAEFDDGEADAIAAWLRDIARERMATEG
jgi:hypothetical protein